jgi:hypothetical protein
MVESLTELRKRVQEPVRMYNDIAGLLVGDRLSIHVTRAFIALGLSPTVGTLAMLVCGLTGSVLVVFGGWWSVAGFACVFLYYIFDCVDGEVARYHRRERLIWGFHDFMFHLYVKSAFYVCLGLYAAHFSGRPELFLFGLSALLSTLFVKALHDVAIVLNARYIILRSHEERERFVRQLTDGVSAGELAIDGDLPGELRPYSFGSLLSVLRSIATNFDLSALFFLCAALLDFVVDPVVVWGVPCDLKVILLAFYGVVLPLEFLDHLWTYIHTDRFTRESKRFLRRAHHFKIERKP